MRQKKLATVVFVDEKTQKAFDLLMQGTFAEKELHQSIRKQSLIYLKTLQRESRLGIISGPKNILRSIRLIICGSIICLMAGGLFTQ